MSSDLCKFITSQCAEFDVLLDALSQYARNFAIDIAILKNKIKEDESRILGSIRMKLPTYYQIIIILVQYYAGYFHEKEM